MSVVSDDRKWQSLVYLAQTDMESAELEGEVMRAERLLDMVKSKLFLSESGTVAERQHSANAHESTSEAHEAWVRAVVAHKGIRAKRATAQILIDVWRSEQANRRQG